LLALLLSTTINTYNHVNELINKRINITDYKIGINLNETYKYEDLEKVMHICDFICFNINALDSDIISNCRIIFKYFHIRVMIKKCWK
jgi:hypothetical protein